MTKGATLQPMSENEQPRPIPIPEGFPVTWDNDEEPKLLWSWDQFHSPLPRTPMTASVSEYTRSGGSRAMKELNRYTPGGLRKVINGYPYGASTAPEPTEAQKRSRERATEEAIQHARRRWDEEWQPRLERDLADMKSVELDSLTDPELLDEIGRFLDLHTDHWYLHHLIVMPVIEAANRLEARYKAIVGDGQDVTAHVLLHGEDTKTAQSIRALDELARRAADSPEVTSILESRVPATTALQQLSELDSGRTWCEALDRFLDEYGYRCAGFDLIYPTWREEPGFVIQNVRARLRRRSDGDTWRAERDRLTAEREAMLDRARSALADDPDGILEFEQLYETAQELWPLKEDHSHYIDQGSTALVRIILAEAGRRLVRAGVTAQPDDVWFLTLEELRESLAAGPREGLAEEIAQRRSDRDRWSRLTPPRYLGTFPAGFKEDRDEADGSDLGPGTLKGTAASAGNVTGSATVVLSPDDFDKIQPGDILVCRSTAPMWTPLFEVVAGLVSEAGGILSHPAVVAREFGLPAVVGVQNATSIIKDGQLVTLAATDGLVHLTE